MNEITIGDISQDSENYACNMNENVTVVVETFIQDTSRPLMTNSRIYTQEKSFILNTCEDVTGRSKLSYTNIDKSFQHLIESKRERYREDDNEKIRGDNQEAEEIEETVPSQSEVVSESVESSSFHFSALEDLDSIIYRDNLVESWETRLKRESERKLWQEFFFAWSVFGLNIFCYFIFEEPSEHIKIICYYLIGVKVLFLLKDILVIKKDDLKDRNKRRKLFTVAEDVSMILFFVVVQIRIAGYDFPLFIGSLPGILNCTLLTILTDLYKDKKNLIKKYLFWVIFLCIGLKADGILEFDWRIVLIPAWIFLSMIGVVGILALKIAFSFRKRSLDLNPEHQNVQLANQYGYLWLFIISCYGPIWFLILYAFAAYIDTKDDSAKRIILPSLVLASAHSVILLSYTFLLKQKLIEWLQRAFAQHSPEYLNSEEAVMPHIKEAVDEIMLIEVLNDNNRVTFVVMVSQNFFVSSKKEIKDPEHNPAQIRAIKEKIMEVKKQSAIKRDSLRKLKTSNARTHNHDYDSDLKQRDPDKKPDGRSPTKRSPDKRHRRTKHDPKLQSSDHSNSNSENRPIDSLQKQISSKGILVDSDIDNKDQVKSQLSSFIPSIPNDSGMDLKLRDNNKKHDDSSLIIIEVNSNLNDSNDENKPRMSFRRQLSEIKKPNINSERLDNDSIYKQVIRRQISNNLNQSINDSINKSPNRQNSFTRYGSISERRPQTRTDLHGDRAHPPVYTTPFVKRNNKIRYSYSDADGRFFQNREREILNEVTSANSVAVGDKNCTLCWCNPPSCIFMPCGHGRICFECVNKVLKLHKTCFYCRKEVENVLQLDNHLLFECLVKVQKVYAIKK